MTDADHHASDRQVFDVAGTRLHAPASPEAQQVLAAAHADRIRPRCLCTTDGVPMYIARVSHDRFIIKRLPDTGMVHAVRCPSHQPPEALSGLGQVLAMPSTKRPNRASPRYGSGSAWLSPIATLRRRLRPTTARPTHSPPMEHG